MFWVKFRPYRVEDNPKNMFDFSPELVARIKKYFLEKYGLVITEDKANEYLDSLARLCESFVEVEDDRLFFP